MLRCPSMALESASIERCLEILAGEVRSDATLSAEFEGSIAVFFRGSPPAAGADLAETLLAARRHLEWFLTEFHSPSLRGAVAERLTDRYEERVDAIAQTEDDVDADGLRQALDALRQSQTGIFEVEEIRAGEGAWLRDLTGFGSFALGDPKMSERLLAHDLLVGRLYPTGDGLNVASPAVAIVRGANIAGALEADLERMRAEGAAKVMRVSQGELEAMFFGAGAVPSVADAAPAEAESDADEDAAAAPEDPVGEAHALLRELGLDENVTRSAIERLAAQPRDPERLVHGGSDVLGRILEELAFDTDVDLDAARAALLRAWELVSLEAQPAAEPSEAGADTDEPDDGARERAIDAFAAGRERGEDATELVKTLRRDLGLGDDADDEPDRPAPDFPGVVGAMIDEMRWELGQTRPDLDARALDPLQHLAEFARPIGVFEELRGHDLFQFATFWLQEKDALASDEEATRLVAALRLFCDWALDAQEVDLGSEFLDALDGLETSLPRIRHANAAIDRAAPDAGDDEDTGELYEVVVLDEGEPRSFEESSDRVRTTSGDTLTVVLDARLRPLLRAGDHVRGRIDLDGTAVVYCCYPPEAAALTQA